MLQAGALRVEGEEGRQGGVLRVEGEERPQGGQSIKKHLSTSLTEISSSPNPGEGEGRSETEVAGREGKQEGENTFREGELTEGQGRVGKPVFRSQSARYISVLILLTIYKSWDIYNINIWGYVHNIVLCNLSDLKRFFFKLYISLFYDVFIFFISNKYPL